MAKAKKDAVPISDEELNLTPVVKKTKDLAYSSNFDKISTTLKGFVEKYKGLKITDANYSEAMSIKKICTSSRNMFETAEKDTIKLFFKLPEAAMKAEFAKLQTLVAAVEKGLDEQIAVFEGERREELKEVFQGYIDKFQGEYKLRPDYLSRVELRKNYFNKTAKEAETRADIRAQFDDLLKEQTARDDDVELITNACKADERLNVKLYLDQLDFGRTASAIMKDIELEKIRLSGVEPPAPGAITVGVPVTGSVLPAGKKKDVEKTMRIEITYKSSQGPAIEEFFKTNSIGFKKIK